MLALVEKQFAHVGHAGSSSDVCSKSKPADGWEERAKKEGVLGVQMVVCTLAGVVRAHVFPTSRFFTSVAKGSRAVIPRVYMVVGPHDLLATGAPPGTFGPVGTAEWSPDLTSIRPLPYHPRNLWCASDIVLPNGESWDMCPRTFLRRQLARLKDATALEVQVGPEIEFHAFEKYGEDGVPDKSWSIHQCGEVLGLVGRAGEMMDDLVDTLQQAGLEINNWHCEGGNIQWEFSLKHREAVLCADEIVYARIAVKAIARKHGLTATMAPKPLGATEIGNGGHLHFSLFDPVAKRNVFPDEMDPSQPSAVAKKFMAGVLRHLRGMSAVLCPTEMSYERAVPHSWAGVWAAWGRENKEAGVRVCCPGGEVSNMELKTGDSTSNPYLAIGTVIACGLDGILNDLDLPPEQTDDPGLLSEEQRKKMQVQRVPSSLAEAMEEMRNDSVIMEAFGDMAEMFLKTAAFVGDYVGKMDQKERSKMYCEKF